MVDDDREEYEPAASVDLSDPAATGRIAAPPRPPTGRMLGVGALLLAVAVVGVLLSRPASAPSAAPRPDPTSSPTGASATWPTRAQESVLDLDGFAPLRLGMTLPEYRALSSDSSRWDVYVSVSSTGDAAGCTQYERKSGYSDAPTAWVWVRDGIIVTVGIVAEGVGRGALTQTAFGLSLGDALPWDREALAAAGWTLDEAAPVTLARRGLGGRTVAVADSDGDGRLDYASVETRDSEQCVYDPLSVPHDTVPSQDPQAPAIEDGGVLGVSIGSPADSVAVAPGWTEGSSPTSRCRVFSAGPGVVAYAEDVVVGLRAPRVSGGPAIGQEISEAVGDRRAMSGPLSADLEATWTIFVPGQDQPVLVDTVAQPAAVPGLDRAVRAPHLLGPAVVTDVMVGRPCLNSA